MPIQYSPKQPGSLLGVAADALSKQGVRAAQAAQATQPSQWSPDPLRDRDPVDIFPLVADGMISTPIEMAILTCMNDIHKLYRDAQNSEHTQEKLSHEMEQQREMERQARQSINVFQILLENLFKQVDDTEPLRRRICKMTGNSELASNIVDAAIFGSMGE